MVIKPLFVILYVIRFLVASPGEDASTQVGVNWHCDTPGSFLQLTDIDDTSFGNAVKFYPEENLWSYADGDDLFKQERYVCKLNLNGLEPGRDYAYRVITADGEASGTGKFRTAEKSCEKWRFVATVDYQPAFNENTLPLLKKLREQAPDARLFLCSGDFTDYGSKEAEWRWAVDHGQIPLSLFAGAPGDHEYWGIKGPQDKDIPQMAEPYGFNSIFNNPQNGPVKSRNSCYYFHYGNVLFIALDFQDSDTVENERLSEELEWFRSTTESLSGTYDFLVVFGHKSMYGSAITDSRVVSVMQPVWAKAYRDAGVDLVISGHDHKYSRTGNIDGTYFLDMGSSGRKYRTPEASLYEDGLHETVIDLMPDKNCVGAVIDVDKDCLDVNVIDKNGITVDHFTVLNKNSKK